MAGMGAWAWANSVVAGFRQRRSHVRVFRFEHEAGKPAVVVEKVVLVTEAVRCPRQSGVHGHPDVIGLAVERDLPREDVFLIVGDGNVLEEELLLLRRTQHDVKLGEALIGEAQILLEVDRRAGDAQRLARDGHVRRRMPVPDRAFDMVRLAGGRIAEGAFRVLGVSRGRRQRERRHQKSVQADSGSLAHHASSGSGKRTARARPGKAPSE